MGTAAAIPLALGSAVGSVASGVIKGQGDQEAANYQAEKADVAAQYAKGAAAETDTQARENLNIQLGNISAIRAAAGTNPTSPTGDAISSRTAFIGDRQRSIQVGNIMAQANQDEADATYLRQSGQYAYTQDILGGLTGAASTLSKTKWS
jgi:hypothetical protein